MIKLANVSASYDGVKVLKNINFDFSGGGNLCVLGANGSGKTTLLKVIGGLLPYEGNTQLFEREVKTLKPKEIAQNVSFLSQISSIYFSYSVYDTVMLGRYVKLRGGVFAKPSKECEEIVLKTLEQVGISHLKDREISTLSGGQLQKVYLARCLCQEPKIIILDEPTNHLDLKSQDELFKLLKGWSKNSGGSVLGVIHDISLAFQLFENAIFLKDGEIVYCGKLKDAKTSDFEKAFDFDVISYLEKVHSPLSKVKTETAK